VDDFKSEILRVFVSQILPVLVTILVGVISTAGGYLVLFLRKKGEETGQNVAAKTLFDVIASVTELVKNVVAHVNAELGEPIHKAAEDGVVTDAEWADLKAKCMAAVKGSLSAEMSATLAKTFGTGVESFLSGLVERGIGALIPAGVTAPVPVPVPVPVNP
jgi:hypothetical protein